MKAFPAILAILGWFALIAQFYINITSGVAPLPETVIRYFSYFTVLTNGIVAVCSTALWLAPESRQGRFFSRPQTVTAIAVYITIVGVIYNVILRSLWQPQGLQKVVDELLHSVIPLLFVLYWFLLAAKVTLQWKNCWPWLLYPLLYIVFILVRGAFSGFYPYPFIHVGEIGMQRALINSAGVALLFLLVSLIFIGIGKWKSGRR